MRSIMLDVSPMFFGAQDVRAGCDAPTQAASGRFTLPDAMSDDDGERGLSEFAKALAAGVDGAIAGCKRALGQLTRTISRLKRKIEGRAAGGDEKEDDPPLRDFHLLQVALAVAVVVLSVLVLKRLR